jgi:hypothetical protein
VKYMDVLNEMFSTEENLANGISAVKALQIAGAEGQRIWTITSENVDIAIPNLNLPDDIISEIRNSAAAGMEITAHEQPVNFYGSSQVGYIILDPATGAGAYKIGGGENGAFVLILSGLALTFFGIGILGVALVGGPVGLLMSGILISAGSLLIAAGFALLSGNSWACSKLVGAAVGMLTYALGLISVAFGGLAAAVIFGALLSDITSICG